MRDLHAGERFDLDGATHDLRIGARHEGVLSERIGAVILPLGADGKLVTDYGPVAASTRELRPGFGFRAGHGVDLDLTAVPATADRLVLILYVVGGAATGVSLADLGEISVEIDSAHRFAVDLGGRREGAMILVEVYRRGAGWRLSANGQGFAAGIAGIAQAYRIELRVADAQPTRGADCYDQGEPRPQPGTSSGGSGFAVARRLLVTNYHVIEHAASISVAGADRTGPAQVVATDPVNDIALVSIDHDANGVARFRGDADVDLGEDIIVGGFPLQGLLGSGPQISGGNVSALTGMRNDSSVLQFNAPIGSGSSGGPILDCSGLVVGLVRSVLRTDLDHAPIAQNINFAVKAALVRSFLHAAGVSTEMAAAAAARPRADVARLARGFLYRFSIEY